MAKREALVYVDFLEDITETEKLRSSWWQSPYEKDYDYISSGCVQVTLALCKAGMGTVEGLGLLANIWRPLHITGQMDDAGLLGHIKKTLDAMVDMEGVDPNLLNENDLRALYQWPFPLWPVVDIREETQKLKTEKLRTEKLRVLREQRKETLQWVFETERKRDPPPAISKEKVLELHRAHLAVEADWNANIRQHGESRGEQGGLRTIPASLAFDEGSDSYQELKQKWLSLTEDERTALNALAWFARGEIADWASAHKGAVERGGGLGERYQLGLRSGWLKGLMRWQAEPKHRVGGEMGFSP